MVGAGVPIERNSAAAVMLAAVSGLWTSIPSSSISRVLPLSDSADVMCRYGVTAAASNAQVWAASSAAAVACAGDEK